MGERLLLDTNVVIDFLRNRPEGLAFVQGLLERPFLSAVVVAELYAGVREGSERDRLDRLVGGFRVVRLDRAAAVRAGLYVRQYRQSHGVGLADAPIAATCVTAGARLVTTNSRHFPMLSDVLVPYPP